MGTNSEAIRSVPKRDRAGLADWGHFWGRAPKMKSRVVGSGLLCRHKLTTLDCEAERGGFEPPLQETCKLVFETSAFNHSATSPSILVRSAAVAGRERIMD